MVGKCVIQEIEDSSMPSQYKNVIWKVDKNKVIIRSNLENMEDINNWVSSFGKQTSTQWNARSSCPNGVKIICSKKFVCHHSSFMKVGTDENKKGLSKNAYCRVSILIVVKLNNSNTRKKDEFVKKLMEKQTVYKNKGIEIRFSEEPFAVVIVTPIMARAHAAKLSKEICFVDSTSACDAEQHAITFVMAPCAAGAISLAIIITKG
ncbi:hypothetical protein ABEB36_000066 [Hypothenemus hampei]|uniref:Uncharacterized protein n=1 Tax=Hypothenemus hampei TaxID=57062 RepID=A0ABD1FA52_HYPHA